jgi:hypothetical protein
MQEQRASALLRMSEGFLGDWQQPSQLYEGCKTRLAVCFCNITSGTASGHSGRRACTCSRGALLLGLHSKQTIPVCACICHGLATTCARSMPPRLTPRSSRERASTPPSPPPSPPLQPTPLTPAPRCTRLRRLSSWPLPAPLTFTGNPSVAPPHPPPAPHSLLLKTKNQWAKSSRPPHGQTPSPRPQPSARAALQRLLPVTSRAAGARRSSGRALQALTSKKMNTDTFADDYNIKPVSNSAAVPNKIPRRRLRFTACPHSQSHATRLPSGPTAWYSTRSELWRPAATTTGDKTGTVTTSTLTYETSDGAAECCDVGCFCGEAMAAALTAATAGRALPS